MFMVSLIDLSPTTEKIQERCRTTPSLGTNRMPSRKVKVGSHLRAGFSISSYIVKALSKHFHVGVYNYWSFPSPLNGLLLSFSPQALKRGKMGTSCESRVV
jgi:hypothetical protein